MPYLLIQTNVSMDSRLQTELIQNASKMVADMLGKPESYVMVALQPDTAMYFAGTSEPTAYLALKSLRLPEQQAAAFSETLCQFMQDMLQIQPERVYIEFNSPQPALWGWNKKTF